MAARKLAQKPVAGNVAATTPTPAAGPVNKVEHAAAVWAAVGRLAEKSGNREELSGGKTYDVKLQLVAAVDGGPIFRQCFEGPLSVAEDSEVAPSHFPGGESLLLAVALSKMNEATRAAVLRDILADYSRGELPAVNAALVESVKQTAKQIRAMFKAPRKGSVSYAGKPAQPTLTLID